MPRICSSWLEAGMAHPLSCKGGILFSPPLAIGVFADPDSIGTSHRSPAAGRGAPSASRLPCRESRSESAEIPIWSGPGRDCRFPLTLDYYLGIIIVESYLCSSPEHSGSADPNSSLTPQIHRLTHSLPLRGIPAPGNPFLFSLLQTAVPPHSVPWPSYKCRIFKRLRKYPSPIPCVFMRLCN